MRAVLIATLAAFVATGCCGKYKDQIAGLDDEVAGLKKDKKGLEATKADLEGRIASILEYQDALESEIDKLGGDKAALSAKFSDAQSNLAAAHADLEATMADLEAKQKLIEEMKKKEELAKKRLGTLKNMLGKFKAMIESGKLKVKVKNGKMVLELPSAILFPSGKAKLSEEGQGTLGEVAAVLSTIPDREFQVAGHTDNVPLGKGSKFKSNWALSTARAVAVVSYLQEMGVQPTSLSAAGYSEYQPATSNDTTEGKAQNRRIEITLMPNLDELPDLSDLEKEL
jgi:chemotaxis protein MotB